MTDDTHSYQSTPLPDAVRLNPDGFPAVSSPSFTTPDGTPYLRAPGVSLLAKPSVNVAGLSDFLDGFAPELQFSQYLDDPTPLSEAAQLCKTAGQLCYMSFGPKRTYNTDAARYFRNIMESGHGSVLEHANFSFLFYGISRACCYDAATEVLTSEGWKQWPDVTGNECFASLCNGQLVFEKSIQHFSGDYTGNMYRVVSEQIDLCVTANHRMYIQPYDTQAAKRKEQSYVIAAAEDILHKRVRYCKTAQWQGMSPEYVEIPATYVDVSREYNGVSHTRRVHFANRQFKLDCFIKFLGWYITEGSHGGATTLCLCQNEGLVAQDMRDVLTAMGLKWQETKKSPSHLSFTFKCLPLRHWLDYHVGNGCNQKKIPALVGTLSPSLIRQFIEAMIDGDGSRRQNENHCVYYTTSRQIADELQVLALKAGWAANIRVDDRIGYTRTFTANGKEHSFQNKSMCYIVSLCKTRTQPLVNHNRAAKTQVGKSGSVRPFGIHDDGVFLYSGKVYCVQVPSGLLYVRRNGKPCWSGNTHELVRHRAGFGFSQQSQRYVSGRVLRFVERPEYQGDAVLHEAFERRIDVAAQDYEQTAQRLLEQQKSGVDLLSGEARTDLRKKVQQAARSVLPNETEAPIVVTGNVRAWRHFLEMRANAHAETEIRALAFRTYLCLAAAESLLFGDYRPIRLSDGTQAVETAFHKV